MSEGISRMRSWRFYYHYLCFSDTKREINEIRRDRLEGNIESSSRYLWIEAIANRWRSLDLPPRATNRSIGLVLLYKTWEKSLVFRDRRERNWRGEMRSAEFYILHWFFRRVDPNAKIALGCGDMDDTRTRKFVVLQILGCPWIFLSVREKLIAASFREFPRQRGKNCFACIWIDTDPNDGYARGLYLPKSLAGSRKCCRSFIIRRAICIGRKKFRRFLTFGKFLPGSEIVKTFLLEFGLPVLRGLSM